MAAWTSEWMTQAACRGQDSVLFYSSDTSERKEVRVERERAAKAICARCEVRESCLRSALDRHESYGIWGGLNELERRALART